MGITRVCYNQTKRKRGQILLAIIFLLAFAVCVYISTQKPKKIVIYFDNAHHIPEGMLKTVLLKATSSAENLNFEESKKGGTHFDHEEKIFTDAVEEKSQATSSSRQTQNALNGDSMLEQEENKFENEKHTSGESSFSSSSNGNKESQFTNINDSLRGFLNHHVWENVCNYQVESLREFILYSQTPSNRRFLLTSSIKAGENGNNFGERIFGFIVPHTSGEYQFAISSSWNSELWLSSDETSENLRKIASLGSRDNPGRCQPGNFYTSPSQISTTVFLDKNVRYFIDIIHKHQSGKSHLYVAWKFPGEAEFTVITSEFLWAKMNDSHVTDNAVRLEDYEEQPQQSNDITPPYVSPEDVQQVLPICSYQPSYLVKHKLIRFQVKNKVRLKVNNYPTKSHGISPDTGLVGQNQGDISLD